MPREEINPGWDFARYTYAPAVRHGDTVYVSGLDAWDMETRQMLCPGDMAGQLRVIYARLAEILAAAGGTLDDIVFTREYVTTLDGYRTTAPVRREVFREPFPASVGVQVVGLVHEGALIELEAVAELGQAPSHGGRTTAQA